MTPLKAFLDEVEEREGKATKGPWHAHAKPHPEAVRLKKEAAGVSSVETLIYSMARDYVCLPETFDQQRADAAFIAAARQDIPKLLALVREAVEALEKIKGTAEEANSAADCWKAVNQIEALLTSEEGKG